MRLHWHRTDLRPSDNLALVTGDDDPILPVYVFDPRILTHAAPPRVAFVRDSLAALREWYRARESDLVVVRGEAPAELARLADEHGADAASWAQAYSGLGRRRDDRVADRLADAGVETRVVQDHLHHEPGSITTNDGDPYSVYSYFWKKWRDREKSPSVSAPGADRLADVDAETPIPTLADLGFDDPEATVPPGGYEEARHRLNDFCSGPIYRYEAARDRPAADATSRLSPHLTHGTVGVRTVHDRVVRARETAPDEDAREAVETFRGELAWREFYHHVLYFDPQVVTENYREYENPIEWREDPEALRAWTDGETGYPIVDAGMRQLRAEAWMHNRVRMIVASFLTKDLLIDWREGYDWFRRKLVDHNPANDNGGWQWAASTGTDAQPYFRIFNPMTQGERHDPDAEYIREYVPELRGVDPELIHDWHDLSPARRREAAPDYPAPIVDHGERRERALAMFERARGEDGD
ncbi:cryptochrome/photolyase family protein [Haloplanus halophilus]|uniref:cryptochrome/photolyase family protein n=1 Tax=Haloplanus halophilus TaxID=2949993 RepID=UPI00203C1106|nr:deoxyribodipyrimidine photo-lyase [Haloplanus sp. GDY1]